MRTKAQINKKIKELKAERKKIKQFSVFGTDNWRSLDERIANLKKAKTMDEDELEEHIENIRDMYDEDGPNFSDNDREKLNDKVEPFEWVLGLLVEDAI